MASFFGNGRRWVEQASVELAARSGDVSAGGQAILWSERRSWGNAFRGNDHLLATTFSWQRPSRGSNPRKGDIGDGGDVAMGMG